MSKKSTIQRYCLFLVLAGAFLLVFLALGSWEAEGKTITVDDDGEGEYTTIQDAINNSAKGDTVRVWAGTYREEILVNKTITIIGNGSEETIVDCDGALVALNITADWVNLSQLTIQNATKYGVHVYQSDEALVHNTTITDVSGPKGKDGKLPKSGGEARGIFIVESDRGRFENNSISFISGGRGGNASDSTGKAGGDGTGIYLLSSDNCNILFCEMSNITAGKGGDSSDGGSGSGGGKGGKAAGVYVRNSPDNTLSHNSISWLRSGDGGNASAWRAGGGQAGSVAGGWLENSSSCHVLGNTVRDLIAGKGGSGRKATEWGSVAAGILLQGSEDNVIANNSISRLTGGEGGCSGECENGGTAAGFHLERAHNNSFRDNIVSSLTGGKGGFESGSAIIGGRGGAATGIFLLESTGNVFQRTEMFGLQPGLGGGGTLEEDKGTPGFATAVWMPDTLSRSNTLTPVKKQNLKFIPDEDLWNTVDGSPVLYFCDISGLKISGHHVDVELGPITLGGEMSSDHRGGDGGISTGLCLWNVTGSQIEDNTISGVTGAHGGTGEVKGSGGAAGRVTGMYLENSTSNNFRSNTISNISAGTGGTGGQYGSGGAGGGAMGIILRNSTGNHFRETMVSDLTRGEAGTGKSPGSPGFRAAFWLTDELSKENNLTPLLKDADWFLPDTDSWNTVDGAPVLYVSNIFRLHISGIEANFKASPVMIGGSTATGGDYRPGADGSLTTGLYLVDIKDSIIENNQFLGLTGMPGGSGGESGQGGTGGTTIGIFLERSQGNQLWGNTISGFAGGVGGPGGVDGTGGTGGIAMGISLDDSDGNILEENSISEISGGLAGPGGNWGVGGTGGASTAVLLRHSEENDLFNTTISTITGGKGNIGSFETAGGPGGTARGLLVDGSGKNHFRNTTIDSVTGGEGGTGGGWASGGGGGAAFGTQFLESPDILSEEVTITRITGGKGGQGGYKDSGGRGGKAAGLKLHDSEDIYLENLTLSGISGGDGGDGGGGGGSKGPDGKEWGWDLVEGSRAMVLGSSYMESNSDSGSILMVKNFLHIEARGSRVPGVHVQVKNRGEVVYASPHFGGENRTTNPEGRIDWIPVTDRVFSNSGSSVYTTTIKVWKENWVFAHYSRAVNMSTSRSETFQGKQVLIIVDSEGGGDFETIQEAIDKASNGTTIRVWDGTYYEHVVVNKTLTLIGNGSSTTVIDGMDEEKDVLTIEENWVNLSGFTVQGSGNGWMNTGVRVESEYNLLENNTFTSNKHGVTLAGGNNTITDCLFFENFWDGLYGSSNDNLLVNNTMNNNERHGARFVGFENSTLEDNSFVSNDATGLVFYLSYHNVVTNSFVSENPTGILLRRSNFNRIEDSNISDQDTGVILDYADENMLSGNSIMDNRIGIDLANSSKGNTAHSNVIQGNVEYALRNGNDEHDINATGNWWGHVSGPYHTSKNTDGKGDPLTDLVEFDPWIEEPPFEDYAAPEAFIDSVAPASVMEGQGVEFYGHGSAYDAIERYVWTSELDGVLYNDSTGYFNTAELSNGSHEITLKIMDNYGVWSAEVGTTIMVNGRPLAEIINAPSGLVLPGENLSFEGGGTDDGSIEVYIWRSDLDGVLYQGPEPSFYCDNLSLGSHSILFRVKDDLGALSDWTQVTVIVNGKPVATIEEVEPNPALETDTVLLRGEWEDDGYIMIGIWESSIDGELGTFQSQELFLTSDSQLSKDRGDDSFRWVPADYDEYPGVRMSRREVEAGSWTLGAISEETTLGDMLYFNLWYRDRDEGYGNDPEFRFVLEHNGVAVWEETDKIQGDAMEPRLIDLEEKLDAALVLAAGDTLELTIYYTGWEDCDIFLGNETYETYETALTFTHTKPEVEVSGLSVGTHTIIFKVQDNHGVWSEDDTTTLVVSPVPQNKIPTVSITSPANGDELKGTVIISGTASDEDGTVERVDVLVDGELFTATGITSWEFELDTTKLDNGEYELKVLSYDGEDYSEDLILKVKVNNEEEEEDDDDGGFLPGFALFGFLFAGMVAVMWWKKQESS